MYLDILKNPIFLGVLAGAITYLYLMWSTDKKKDPKSKKSISLFTPIVVAVIVSIIAYVYFNYVSHDTTSVIPEQQIIKKQLDGTIPITNYHFVKEMSSESPASFHLISRGVNIPNNLNVPDVFIETY